MKQNWLTRLSIFILLFCSATSYGVQNVDFKTITTELHLLQQKIVPDKRVAILEFEIKDTLKFPIVIVGQTTIADAKVRIANYFTDKNIAIIDSIRLLPDVAVGEKKWALTMLSVSNMRAKPDDASELVSQTLMGTPLKVLDCKNKWFRVQSPEGYLGWMDSGGLFLLTENDFNKWKNSERLIYNSITGYVYDSPKRNSGVVSDITLGSLLVVVEWTKNSAKVELPDGRVGFVKRLETIPFEKWCNTKPDITQLIATAKQMMGSPYLWGGASGKAADCSGYTKLLYFSQGIILMRDASQQILQGEKIDITDIQNLKTGDLLFFGKSAQRATHVGIYLENGDFIHASGRVHISSIIPKDAKYNPSRNFVAARRMLNQPPSSDIAWVKNHPWYTNQP